MTNSKKPTMSQLPEQKLENMNAAEASRSIHPTISQATNEYDYLSEKVKIQFFNLEQPGNKQLFMCGPVTSPDRFELQHGEIRDLTRAQIRFIETRQVPQYAYRADGTGKIRKTLVGYSPRFQCRPIWDRIKNV